MDKLTESILAQVCNLSDESKSMVIAYAYDLRKEEQRSREKEKLIKSGRKISEKNGKIIRFHSQK